MSSPSLLPIVLNCDNVPPLSTLGLTPFYLTSSSSSPIGRLPANVLAAVLPFVPSAAPSTSSPLFQTDSSRTRVFFADWCDSVASRTTALGELASSLRASGEFKIPLDGWRNETYSIYGPADECPGDEAMRGKTFGRNVAFSLERAACGLFGVTSFGVHLTGYVLNADHTPSSPSVSVWVPRRSKTKQTYPSMLDQTVAGGLTHGLSPLECVVKECAEEASIPEGIVKNGLRATGAITYVATAEGGWIQPEVQFCYDLLLPSPSEFKPTPDDGEAEYFELMSVLSILTRLHAGEFKPNCALVMIDFLIRHSFVTPESEPFYLDILRRLRRDLDLPGIVGWGA